MKSVVINRALRGEFTLIAEIGVNYYDIAKKEGITPIEAAKKMIKEAKAAGIHAVKFQTYKADTIAAKASPSYWDLSEEPATSQYELFKRFDSFGEKEYRELSEYCDALQIEFLSTPFDYESADYLDDLMKVYKISSSDLNNRDFVRYIAGKKKPIILSIGASNREEIEETLKVIKSVNNEPLILMHCVLEYPTPYEHANLKKISSIADSFPDVIAGYSDHTKPDPDYQVIKTALRLGAVVVEKHFTLDKTLKGNDHYHAMDEQDAKRILQCMEMGDITPKNDMFDKMICGCGDLVCLESEQIARANARRSLVAAKDLMAGTVIEETMLVAKRPGCGIAPDLKDTIVGKRIKVDAAADTILTEEMF